MRILVCLFAFIIVQVSAFTNSVVRSSRVTLQMKGGEKSVALPFLPRPAKLDGSAPVCGNIAVTTESIITLSPSLLCRETLDLILWDLATP